MTEKKFFKRKNKEAIINEASPAVSIKDTLIKLSKTMPYYGKYTMNTGWFSIEDAVQNYKNFDNKSNKMIINMHALDAALNSMKNDPSLDDKEIYLRGGYDSRGMSNLNTVIVLYHDKEKGTFLYIFNSNKNNHVAVREYFKALNYIK